MLMRKSSVRMKVQCRVHCMRGMGLTAGLAHLAALFTGPTAPKASATCSPERSRMGAK